MSVLIVLELLSYGARNVLSYTMLSFRAFRDSPIIPLRRSPLICPSVRHPFSSCAEVRATARRTSDIWPSELRGESAHLKLAPFQGSFPLPSLANANKRPAEMNALQLPQREALFAALCLPGKNIYRGGSACWYVGGCDHLT